MTEWIKACEQCGKNIDPENCAELHCIVAGEREVLEFCDYACADAYIIGHERSERKLREFQGEEEDEFL